MVSMIITFPSKKIRKNKQLKIKRYPKPKVDKSSLKHDPDVACVYSSTLEKHLENAIIKQDVNVIADTIGASITLSLQTACPNVEEVRTKNP